MVGSYRSLDYTERDRTAHYAGTAAQPRCPVCLCGMPNTHGVGQPGESCHIRYDGSDGAIHLCTRPKGHTGYCRAGDYT